MPPSTLEARRAELLEQLAAVNSRLKASSSTTTQPPSPSVDDKAWALNNGRVIKRKVPGYGSRQQLFYVDKEGVYTIFTKWNLVMEDIKSNYPLSTIDGVPLTIEKQEEAGGGNAVLGRKAVMQLPGFKSSKSYESCVLEEVRALQAAKAQKNAAKREAEKAKINEMVGFQAVKDEAKRREEEEAMKKRLQEELDAINEKIKSGGGPSSPPRLKQATAPATATAATEAAASEATEVQKEKASAEPAVSPASPAPKQTPSLSTPPVEAPVAAASPRRRAKKVQVVEINSEVRASFEAIDTDGSGELDKEELRAALKGLGMPSTPSQAAVVMAKYDTDGDGTLNLAEFNQLLKDLGRID